MERSDRHECWRRRSPVTQPRVIVRKRGCRHGNRSPHPARQLHKHMIAPAGALPVDHRKPLTKERMGAVSNCDLSTGSLECRGTLPALVL
jgi:hypothetical protein